FGGRTILPASGGRAGGPPHKTRWRLSPGSPSSFDSVRHHYHFPVSRPLVLSSSRLLIPPSAAPMRHVLAIDQGTTGSTCLVVRADGAVVGRAYREISQHYPQPGWVEHDAEEIFHRTRDAAREAIAMAGVMPDAIGITNQRETIVLWE